jgi:23S rRNA (guanine2069-N7)-methyltransferase / 23S rRNA (guanine2445-N2)-methyltransferase
MIDRQDYFATAPKGIEDLVSQELESLGALEIKTTRAGVAFKGNLEIAYKACLWLRTANRVLFPISNFTMKSPEELYQGVMDIDWNEHMGPEGSLLIDFSSSHSIVNHSRFGAQKAKDAVVDQFRDRFQKRPSVKTGNPDLRINIYVLKNKATVSIDLSGQSLHRRGYRLSEVEAPLKENLAAAILIKAGWPEIAKSQGGLIDPMCGSGTIPIEAAMMAADSAPGLLRDHFGFMTWKKHQPELWQKLLDEAEDREIQGLNSLPFIAGYDSNAHAVTSAIESAERAGLKAILHFEKREFGDCKPHPRMKDKPGLVILNPPYGVRLGQVEELKPLYSNIGRQFKEYFPDWNASVFTGNESLGKSLGLRASKKTQLFNGAIACTLLNFHINSKSQPGTKTGIDPESSRHTDQPVFGDDITMFANRIRKNYKKLRPWLKNNKVSCYRLYDKDIPEFAVSIDIYGQYAHVQEYQPPESIDPQIARKRLTSLLRALPGVLDLPAKNVFQKVRRKQTGAHQYQRMQFKNEFFEVTENDCRFLVNFTDYLDTGLFLDHRSTRQLIGDLVKNKRVLNLFSYTGSVTVYAAKNGARHTDSVDSSNHYLSWAKKNLALNGISESKHQFHQSDCMEWMKSCSNTYDLIFLDPPTFSNSKNRKTTFDLQKDHVKLIRLAMKLLSPDGLLVFSNNYRKFKLNNESLEAFSVENITTETIPRDFHRSPKIHQCWKISHPS